MSRLILGFPNQVDATFFDVAFSGGSWEATLPLTNLRDRLLANVARSTDAALASTQFDVDLGVSRPVRLFCIPRCNISRNGLIRIRGSDTAGDFSAPVYDTGWLDVWTVIYAWGSLPWGSPSWWDGKLAAEDAADYDTAFIHVADVEQSARYWRWEIDDTGNDAGYVQLSRLVMAPGWQPSRNFQSGAEIGVTTGTTVKESLGGVRFFDRRKPRRYVRFQLKLLDQDEMLSQAFEMERRLGIDRQVMVVMNPGDSANLHRTSFLGSLRDLSPLEYELTDYLTTAYQIEEVL